MKKIWNYEDYVTRLKHPDSAVREWAFRGLEERYRNKYTDEVASLIGDENTHLACMAPRYLARHSAEQHAEKILTCFQNSEGNVRSNCAMALGRLKYEPAVDSMRELFLSSKRGDSFFGLLDYFANVDLDDCRELLREAMDQLSDPFELEAVATSLLRHFQPQDTEVIVDSCLTQIIETNSTDRFLQRIANVLSGEGYFREITEGQFDILEQPKECIDHLFSNNPSLSPSTDLLPGLIKALADGRIAEFTTMIMFAAKTILQKRYPKKTIADWLVETHNKDKTTLALLETLTKRSALWEAMDNGEHSGQNMVALVLAALCGILDRQNTLPALAPEASLDDLLQALARAGSDFPKVLRDKIIAAQPESELTELLTNELLTWGDIWVVQLMGKIAYPAFIPHLLRVINETDGLSYIHDHALTAINCIADEEGDKHLLEAIQNRKVDDSISSMSILRHLSYEEAYDLALEKWHDKEDDIDDYETFAVCLEGIGDPRGVKTLQNIYKHETTHAGVGDPLEGLARLHDMDIPELATIAAQRQENEESRKNRAMELAQLARNYERNKDRDAALPAQILPFKRETAKVGRNEPCPCGSGKKYKKCCLRK